MSDAEPQPNTPKLQPCPWCGKEPYFHLHRDLITIYCDSGIEACPTRPHLVASSYDEGERLWNTRNASLDRKAQELYDEVILWRNWAKRFTDDAAAVFERTKLKSSVS